MKLIPTKIHGVLDYVLAAILIIWPRLRLYDTNLTLWLTIVGVAIIVISLLTDYELSLAKIIPMPTHIVFDILVGALLIVLPFLLIQSTTIPLIVLGFGAILVGAMTQTHSSASGEAASAS